MTTTQHPLTETEAAELWDGRLSDDYGVWHRQDHIKKARAVAAFRAAFDAGREHERTTTEDDRPWEPLNGPVRVGDEVRRDHSGLTTIAVVGRVDKSGDPWTAEGACIGLLRYGTWYVRRAPAHTTEKETPMTETTTPAEPLARTLLAVPEGHGAPHHDAKEIKADDFVVQVDEDGHIRAGIAHRQAEDGDWSARGGEWITWAARRADRPDAITVWPAPTPPAVEVEMPNEFGAVITDVEDWSGETYDRLAFLGLAFEDSVDKVHPDELTAFTLPDGTRARRDGEHANGEPRFVKEARA